MPPGPKGKFVEGEKLLCYHGPLLYEAKCVKTKKDSNNFLYFVHYQGWNKNWDEWVNDTRILKINPENLEKKERLYKECVAALRENKKKTPKGGVTPGPLGSGTPTAKESKKGGGGSGSANTSRASTPVSERSMTVNKKTIADDERSTSSREDESIVGRKCRQTRLSETLLDEESGGFHIEIPEELKYVLVSDCDLVTSKKSLFNLPAKTTVSSILNDYIKSLEKTQPDNISVASEVMLGFKDVFNAVVRTQLLYKLERRQFIEKIGDGESLPSDVYGSAHLLRLMVKIGPILNKTNMVNYSESDVAFIENIITDFLGYLESQRTKLFTSKNYSEASEDYLKNVHEVENATPQ